MVTAATLVSVNDAVRRTFDRLHRFWDQQVHLQQLYLDRTCYSGLDAVRAMRSLHWNGSELVGDLLPGERFEPGEPR
jgi:hypothetical protein